MKEKTSPTIVTRPAKETHVIGGHVPIAAAGVILSSGELTEYEKSVLTQLGYDGKSDVPSNLGDLLSSGKYDADMTKALNEAVATVTEQLPPGFEMPTQSLDVDKIKTIRDDAYVADAASRYAKVTSEHVMSPPMSDFERARAAGIEHAARDRNRSDYHPDVLRALQELEQKHTEVPSSAPETKEEEDKPAAAEETPVVDKKEKLKNDYKALLAAIEPEDVAAYEEAVLLNGEFHKTYAVSRGRVHITFSEPGPDEVQMAVQQEAIDVLKGRYSRADMSTFLDVSARYTLASCLRSVKVNGKEMLPLPIPDDCSVAEFLRSLDLSKFPLDGYEPDDTPIRFLYRLIVTRGIKTSLYRVVNRTFNDFQRLYIRLEALSQMPDFIDDLEQ